MGVAVLRLGFWFWACFGYQGTPKGFRIGGGGGGAKIKRFSPNLMLCILRYHVCGHPCPENCGKDDFETILGQIPTDNVRPIRSPNIKP